MTISVDVIKIFEETKTSDLGDGKIIIKVWGRYISEFDILILDANVSYNGVRDGFSKPIQDLIISNFSRETIHQVCLADACRLSLRKVDDLMNEVKAALREPVQLDTQKYLGDPYR